GGQLEVSRGEEGAVAVRFPAPVTGGNEVYAFRFRTRVFLQSTVFSVQLQSSEQPDLLQEVVGGDATQVVATQSLSVVSRLTENSLLEDVQIEPRAITPNGDGINDRVEIRISIYHLEREKTLGVEVFDLSGRRVRDLSVQRSFPSGEHVFTWDGRDDEARIVPPGLYVMRIDIATDSDAAGTSTARLLHVAY
ncbi:MAG: FlgD immunoglobulin-like domain containing protein, partial [Candidatus Latescibacterota bacterium]|nr:FlgD immunoglobulin-like domain containing protein [Candidatus Latescibacterota bacterium]